MLKIKNLTAGIDGKTVIKGLDLEVSAGEVHSIMGPNGHGKSTLAKIVAGHPDYTVEGGSVEFLGEDLLVLEPEQRAMKGIFLAYQYPVEVPGVNNAEFLHLAYNARQKYLGLEELDPFDFDEVVREKMKLLHIDESFLERGLNEGFSGGEKKKNEILQMALLEPKLAFLDEIDSGLDVDALKVVAEGINRLRDEGRSMVLITHYPRILEYVTPDKVHVYYEGKIERTGDITLARELEKSGYENVLPQGV